LIFADEVGLTSAMLGDGLDEGFRKQDNQGYAAYLTHNTMGHHAEPQTRFRGVLVLQTTSTWHGSAIQSGS
jgi:hypothetical protein